MPRYFVPLIDAAEGRFTDCIEAPIPPQPLAPNNAPTLHDYLRSFVQERFNWALAKEGPIVETPRMPPGRMAIDEARSAAWQVRLSAMAVKDGPIIPLIGFTVKPAISILRMYVWTYLLLDHSLRGLEWVIVDTRTGQALDWTSEDIVDPGDYYMMLNGNIMMIAYATSDLFFPPRNEKYEDGRSTADAGTGAAASASAAKKSKKSDRAKTPKDLVRNRDTRCLISGELVMDPSTLPGVIGNATVAHLLPFGQPSLIHNLRYALDPSGFGNVQPSDWRARVKNHPSNLMILGASVESMFDRFHLVVDPLVITSPQVLNVTRDGRLVSDRQWSLMLNPDKPFPKLPYGTKPAPGPAPACLLAHMIAALAWSYRHRMTHEPESESLDPESGRSASEFHPFDFIANWQENLDVTDFDNTLDPDLDLDLDQAGTLDLVDNEDDLDLNPPSSDSEDSEDEE